MSEIISKDTAVPELTTTEECKLKQLKALKAIYDRVYYIKNIDKIKTYKGTKVECFCGGRYTVTHKARHERSDIHIRSLEIS